jgi:predicted nuclease of predicted toxin-antitoxin system
MRFIIDAHLPAAIKRYFSAAGFESVHASELPKGNSTPDEELVQFAGLDGVIITKDEDFYQSFLLKKRPSKLILVKFGNLRLHETIEVFSRLTQLLIELIDKHDLVELYRDRIIVVNK